MHHPRLLSLKGSQLLLRPFHYVQTPCECQGLVEAKYALTMPEADVNMLFGRIQMADRSPNYPGFRLEAALEFARQIYNSDGRTAAPLSVVAKALGYTSVSGNVRGKVASLRQYGLVDDVQMKIRVSDRALRLIKLDPSDPEFIRLLQQAALQPALFSELYNDMPEASDNSLEVFLETEKRFSREGAKRVINAYRETLKFAQLSHSSSEVALLPAPEIGDEQPLRNRPLVQWHRPLDPSPSVRYSWPLGDGNKVDLAFVFEPTQSNIDALLDQLQIMRRLAPVSV